MKENYISTKEIIAKVYRDNGYTDELPWADLIVWTDEALRLIDQPLQFIRQVVGDKSNPALDIHDFKAKLPCNIYKIEQIAVNGHAAYRATGTSHHIISDRCCTVGQTGFVPGVFIDGFHDITIDGNELTGPNEFTSEPDTVSGSPIEPIILYDINNDFITLSIKQGKVCIMYLAYPLDEDGFPLIPDVQQYKEMVAAYLRYKMDYRMFRIGMVNREVYEDSQAKWFWYAGAAASKMKMPSVDKMESLMNQIVRLKPNMNAYKDFFVTLGLPENKPLQY